jgi:serine phosphatase RsbU (regulator of sigma subunit)
VHWTEPYTFFTLKVPGVTASTTFAPGHAGGRTGVVAVDVLLSDVSEYTSTLRPTQRGLVVALTDDGHVIGLPQGAGIAADRASALLKKPEDIGLAVVGAAVAAASRRADGNRGPARFDYDREAWWGEVRKFPLGGDRALSVAVLVPEADILGTLGAIRWWIVVFTAGALALAAVWAVRLALRYSRPIEVLARENERIGLGDLEAGPEVRSSVTEVQRLVRAHERMRLALRTLFKVERDLQVARRIQQSTLPEALPALSGFEVDAWCEPADATGGDTYDVIGLRAPGDGAEEPAADRALVATDGAADRAVLFLADADGHGIGPALSVTLVRAMLRMGLRAGLGLPAIVRRMNAQLAADLRDGHFVTAWFAALDVRTATLASLCCGHGPVLHWVAAEGQCHVIPADTVPLGILSEIDLGAPVATRLAPGDVVLVMSDGVFDALDGAGERFGVERVVAILREYSGAPAAEILAALRRAVDAFTGDAPAEDDRTAIVLARRG